MFWGFLGGADKASVKGEQQNPALFSCPLLGRSHAPFPSPQGRNKSQHEAQSSVPYSRVSSEAQGTATAQHRPRGHRGKHHWCQKADGKGSPGLELAPEHRGLGPDPLLLAELK